MSVRPFFIILYIATQPRGSDLSRFNTIIIRIAAVVIVLLTVTWFSLPWLIPKVVDTRDIIVKIQTGIREAMGIRFVIKDLRIKPTLFDGLHVQLASNRIYDLKGRDIGNVEMADIKVSYLPLIQSRKVEIKRIHLKKPFLPVGEASLFNQIAIKLEDPDKPKVAELKDASIIATDYVIHDYRVADHNNMILKQAKGFVIEGRRLRLDHLMDNNPDQPLNLTMNGRMFFDPVDKTGVKARYDLSLRFPEEAVKQETGGKFSWDDIDRFRLKLDEGDLAMTLKLEGGKGRLESRAASLMQAEALYHQMSDTFEVATPELAYESYLAGKITADLAFDLNELEKKRLPTLNGRVSLDGVTLSDRNNFKNPVFDRIDGLIRFKDKTIQLDKLVVLLDRHRFVLDGWYRMDSRKMDIRMVAKNLQLASLKRTVQRLADMLDLPLQDLSLYQVAGLVNVNLRLFGTPDKLGYTGQLQLQQGSYKDLQTGLLLTRLFGDIEIKQRIFVKQLKGFAGSTPFLVKGSLTRDFDAYSLELISNRVNIETFFKEILASLPQTRAQLAEFGTPQGIGDAHLYLTKRPELAQPDYRGNIRLAQGRYTDPKTRLTVQDIAGIIDIDGRIQLRDFQGFLGSTRFTLAGVIDKTFKDYRLNLQSNDINLQTFMREVLAKLPEFRDDLAQLKSASGTGTLNLTVTDEAGINGVINLNQLAVRPAALDSTIRFPHAVIRLNGEDITIAQTRGSLGPIGFIAQGQANFGGNFRFSIDTGQTPMSVLRKEPDFISNLTGFSVPRVWNTAGTFDFAGVLTQSALNGTLVLDNAGLSWEGGDFPLYDMNGRLSFAKAGSAAPTFTTDNLTLKYGNSPLRVTANYDGKMHLLSEGVLSPLLLNHLVMSPRSTTTPYREVPFEFSLDGDLAALLPSDGPSAATELTAALFADLSATFMPREEREQRTANVQDAVRESSAKTAETLPSKAPNVDQPEDRAEVTAVQDVAEAVADTRADDPLVAEVAAPQLPESIEPTATHASLIGHIRLAKSRLTVDDFILNLGESGQLSGSGYVASLPSMDEYAFQVVTSPELDFTKMNTVFDRPVFERAQGSIATDLVVSASPEVGNRVDGWLEINGLQLPQLQIRNLTADAEFDGQFATLTVSTFEVPGVNAGMRAKVTDLSRIPVELEDVSITGSRFVVEAFNDFNENILNGVITKQFFNQLMPPRQEGDPVLPFEFRDADLAMNEVIYQNIILEEVKGRMSMFSNGYLELADTELKAAEGKVRGFLSMNPNDNHFASLDITTEDVKANALTKALLNVTNQIFGDIDGTVRFTTHGTTDVELMENANGTVEFVIQDGRLPAIAKIETLLTAANIVRGGVLGLNLNNLFRSVAAYNTNYFAEMSGSFQIAEGTMYTSDLVSDGENLDLYIQGEIAMQDGSADLLVNGLMSQDVSGELGALGKLSIGSVVRWIPGIGFLPGDEERRRGIIQRIPLLGYIPGLGGAPEKNNRFQVRIQGMPDDPNAIKDFTWVRSRSL